MPYQLDLRPGGEFDYTAAKNKLVGLRIGQHGGPRVTFAVPGDVRAADGELDYDDGSAASHGQLLKLAGWIDLESQVTVGCAGAILSYIKRRRTASFLPDDAMALTMFRTAAIEMFTLNGLMFVNTDTLLSLQVIQSESHPHTHNQGPTKSNAGAKEGLSIYGLFHHLACSPQGKYLLRQYFLRPSLNLDVINQRLSTISIMVRPENSEIMDRLIQQLKPVKNMRTVMISLRKGISGGMVGGSPGGGVNRTVWSSIREFVFRTMNIKDALRELICGERLAIIAKVLDNFDFVQLKVIGRSITQTVDFELSAEHHRSVVLAGIDEELDNMKRTYEGLENLLSRVADHISQSVPAELDAQVNVIFFPQIGFLIAVRHDPLTGRGAYEGSQESPWEKMFTTNEFAYYKNDEVSEMDSYLGDVYGQICGMSVRHTSNRAPIHSAQTRRLKSCKGLPRAFCNTKIF